MSEFLQQNPGVLDAFSAASSVAQGVTGYVTAANNAEALKREGKFAQQQSLRDAAQLLGKQTALFGASGVDASSGTPLDVYAQTARDTALEAARAGYGFQNEARNQEIAGLAEFSKGLAVGTDTLLTNYAKRKIANPDVYTGDKYTVAPSGWSTKPYTPRSTASPTVYTVKR